MRSVELFVGAGGLGMGVARAGFKHVLAVEKNPHACETLRNNQWAGLKIFGNDFLHEGDVREVDYSTLKGQIDLVAGGPPCQPFSLAGRHRGQRDKRDMFPEAVRAIRELRPWAFIFENVRGLTRTAFHNYFQYILLQLEFPDVVARGGEEWPDHLRRLERHKTGARGGGLKYRVVNEVVDAADYGVPQNRGRVFIVGFREDTGLEWSFPKGTNTREALWVSQWVTGEYWERHEIGRRERPAMPKEAAIWVDRFRKIGQSSFADKKPWLTVRDAIFDLPEPYRGSENGNIANHRFQAGARSYPGHTGSPFDEPAKTLKAGDHGVPGGENMLRHPNSRVRYFSVRESARLQTFPDEYVFYGSWTEAMRQIGNAVPVKLAEFVASSVVECLSRENKGMSRH